MKSLLESNPYLADPEYRRAMLRNNARQSSIFEGARGISAQLSRRLRSRRSRASIKKAVKGL
jgi:ribosomal protein S3